MTAATVFVCEWDRVAVSKRWDGSCQSTCHSASECLSWAQWSSRPPRSLVGSHGNHSSAQSCYLQPFMQMVARLPFVCTAPGQSISSRFNQRMSSVSHGSSDGLFSVFVTQGRGVGGGWPQDRSRTVGLFRWHLHFSSSFFLIFLKKICIQQRKCSFLLT